MRVRLARKRTLLAAGLCVGAVVGVSQSNEAHITMPYAIFGEFQGQPVTVTATSRSAGAIESLQWGGVEFIDANDHGRDLQSAVSFDGLTECDNPTEAGSSRDGVGASTSSSRLEAASVDGNVLRTRSRMANWLRMGQWSAACGLARNDAEANLSSTRLAKTVRFLPLYGNVLEHRITFDLARSRALAQFEVLTAYMPFKFGTFYRLDPASDRLQPLSDGPGEQELPVVLSTADGTHALGLYTLQTAKPGLAGPGYGRWRFNAERVTKSNVVFRQTNAAAGPHRFVVYTVFGSLDDVRASLGRLYQDRATIVADNAPAEGDLAPLMAMESGR